MVLLLNTDSIEIGCKTVQRCTNVTVMKHSNSRYVSRVTSKWLELISSLDLKLVLIASLNNIGTVLVLIKLTKFAVALRLRCGTCKLFFLYIISSFFVFKNVVHSLEHGETPSNSASHQDPNYVQRS